MLQAERHGSDGATASKIDEAIAELEAHAAGRHAFTFVLEDPAGNSYIGAPAGADGGGVASE